MELRLDSDRFFVNLNNTVFSVSSKCLPMESEQRLNSQDKRINLLFNYISALQTKDCEIKGQRI